MGGVLQEQGSTSAVFEREINGVEAYNATVFGLQSVDPVSP